MNRKQCKKRQTCTRPHARGGDDGLQRSAIGNLSVHKKTQDPNCPSIFAVGMLHDHPPYASSQSSSATSFWSSSHCSLLRGSEPRRVYHFKNCSLKSGFRNTVSRRAVV